MQNSDDPDFLKSINKIHEADRRFFFEMLMHMNGCDRNIAQDLYPFLGDSAGACKLLYLRQQRSEFQSRSRFTDLLPADAYRFIQIMEHFGRDQKSQPLALSDFLELLAQEPESLREFLSLSDNEKTIRFNALLERFHSQDADLKSSLDSISEKFENDEPERSDQSDTSNPNNPDSN